MTVQGLLLVLLQLRALLLAQCWRPPALCSRPPSSSLPGPIAGQRSPAARTESAARSSNSGGYRGPVRSLQSFPRLSQTRQTVFPSITGHLPKQVGLTNREVTTHEPLSRNYRLKTVTSPLLPRTGTHVFYHFSICFIYVCSWTYNIYSLKTSAIYF